MKVDKNYYIVDKNVLPEVFLKVVEAKGLLDSGKERTVQAAVARVGISRSVFYKYRDAIFPLYEHSRGRTITMSANLEDKSGLLSTVLNQIAGVGANILTIHQTIPINGVANLTVTIETADMQGDIGQLVETVEALDGIQSFKIIARE